MFKKASLKSFFRITALTMAFLLFAVTGAQSYSLAAGVEKLQSDQEVVTSTEDNIVPETVADESSNITEDARTTDDESQSQSNVAESPSNENYHNVNIGDFDIIGEDVPLEESKVAWVLPWVGWEIGKVIVWLAAGAAVGVTVIEGFVEAKAFVSELTKSKQKDKPKYYRVKYDKLNLYVGAPLTDDQAFSIISSPYGEVWTPSYNDGRILAAKFAGKNGKIISENHSKKNYNDTRYFWHFHGEKSNGVRSGHIFQGTEGQMGQIPKPK
ncbi:hypothetical protein MHB43_21060 [Paenibacillus sp. FSL H8-0317]|uniref:hypothetical protein n=1 Tax=unclassified Paenibacillus TaxID=185978 RepID=UPI0030CB9FFA